MIRLLIFDLDGTLIDSAPDIITTTNTFMRQRGRDPLPDEAVKKAIGEGLRQLVFGLFPECHSDPLAFAELEREFYTHYARNLLSQTDVFPGVHEFLERCDRKISIVTNKHESLALKTIGGLSLKNFDWVRIFGGDSFPFRKPHPRPLLETLKAAGVDRSEAVMIGDGLPDVIAAHRAGIHSIACEYGYSDTANLRALKPSLSISSFDQLDQALIEIESLPAKEIIPASEFGLD